MYGGDVMHKRILNVLIWTTVCAVSACANPGIAVDAGNSASPARQASADGPPADARLVAVPTLAGDALPFAGYHDRPASPNVQEKDGQLLLDTRFVARLLAHPDGALFDANRHELLYLIARNDLQAVGAGFAVLAHLLRHPETDVEGDREYQRYGKEELAFALSRTENAPLVLCRMPEADSALVIAFYRQNPVLWRNTDPPWQPGNLVCNG